MPPHRTQQMHACASCMHVRTNILHVFVTFLVTLRPLCYESSSRMRACKAYKHDYRIMHLSHLCSDLKYIHILYVHVCMCSSETPLLRSKAIIHTSSIHHPYIMHTTGMAHTLPSSRARLPILSPLPPCRSTNALYGHG